MKKKVLIIYARYGTGHQKMAEYVKDYIASHNHKVELLLLDMTPYGNLLGKIGVKLWDGCLKLHLNKAFDFIYEIMDNPTATLLNNLTAKKSYDNPELREIITNFNPDITISTHFFCSNIMLYYKKLNLTKSKIYTIITDYHTHEFWVRNKNLEDGYIVGNEIVKKAMLNKGIKAHKVLVYGLPLNIEELNNLEEEEVIKKKYHLNNLPKTYLFFGGSSTGSMYYFDYFKAICKIMSQANIIFICGKHQKLKKKCEAYLAHQKINNIQVLGYSNDVLNLMKVSSLVITKPGGSTITEALEMKVPMLLIPGIGGQEKYNAKFIMKKKYGLTVRNLRNFKKTLLKIENNPKILKEMQQKLNKRQNNAAVIKINNLINK